MALCARCHRTATVKHVCDPAVVAAIDEVRERAVEAPPRTDALPTPDTALDYWSREPADRRDS